MPAFLRDKNSAAWAGRIANRKQVIMQIIQPVQRKALRRLATILLLTSYSSTMIWAAADSTAPSPASPPSPKVPTGKTSTAQASASTTTAAKTTQIPEIIPTPQSPADATSAGVATMPTIVVTAATRSTQPIDTTATTTSVLTNQFLDDNKYALVPDALQSVLGLAVVTSGAPGAQTSVFIHGMESRQTLVTIDGRRQSAGFSGADDNLANLTLDNVDQIEIVRTPTTAVQGGGAMGGVINLVTLSGKGLATPIGSVSEEAGSFNTFRENLQSRGAVGNFDYAVSATRQDSIYPALSPGTPAEPFGSPGFTGQASQYRNTSYRGNFGYQITPDVYVDLHSAYSNSYTSSPNEFVTPDPTASLTIEDWNLSPEVVAKVTDFYSTKLYYTRDQQRQANNDPYEAEQLISFGDSPQGEQARTQINTDSVDWQNDFQIAHNWSVTAGLQGDNRHFYINDNNLGNILNGHDDNIGGYLTSQWQPITGLNVLSSGRLDEYSEFGGAFSWRQGVSYEVQQTHTTFHASGSQAFTPPSLQDLYVFNAAGAPFFGPFLPNPSLKPETDLGWEAGVDQPLWDGRVTPSFTYFHNDIHNDIENVERADNSFINENLDKVTTQGFEFALTVKPCDTVTLQGSYTYLHAEDDVAQLQLVRRPRNTINFTGTWQPIRQLTLTLGGNWIMDRRDLDASLGNEELAPDYFTLRASATYEINEHVSLWVRGENLTDRNYQPSLGFYATSIAGYGGIKISF
jgi:vitamin B12 transporter